MFAVIMLVGILMGITASAIMVGAAILYMMKTDDEIRKQINDPWKW